MLQHITRRKNTTVSPNENICLSAGCYISVWLAKLGIKTDAGVDCVRRTLAGGGDMWARLLASRF